MTQQPPAVSSATTRSAVTGVQKMTPSEPMMPNMSVTPFATRVSTKASLEVIRVDDNFVVVNAGLKSESYIPADEFRSDRADRFPRSNALRWNARQTTLCVAHP